MLKSKNQWSFGQIYFQKWNKLAVFSNFLAFFLFIFDKFSLLDPDPDPEGKKNADPWRSGSTALVRIVNDCTYCICVVNDYTDTRFLRISSRRRKRSQNSFLSVHMGPRWRFLIKKCRKSRDTVPLSSIEWKILQVFKYLIHIL